MVSYDWTIKATDLDFIVTLSIKTSEAKKGLRKGMLQFGLFAVFCFLLAAALYFLPGSSAGRENGGIAFICFLGLYLLIQCVLLPFNQKRAVHRSVWQGDPHSFSTRHLEFREDGLAIFTDLGSRLQFWKGFRYWGIKENYFFLVDIANSYILIDRNAITEGDLQEIIALLCSQQVPSLN